MKRTIVLLSHNRPIQDKTRECINALTRAGGAFLVQSGCADVALARSFALTSACNTLRQLNEQNARRMPPANIHPSAEALWKPPPPRDTVLMVDDDMVFTVDQAQELVTHARATGIAASAIYATTLATVAATRLPALGPDRWLTGLGLLAIPSQLLLELERDSESFTLYDQTHTAFTWSRAEGGAWMSEDYTLCKRLGGVHLLPIGVGHLKTFPIYPDEETIASIRDGRPLQGEPDPAQMAHLTDADVAKVGAL